MIVPALIGSGLVYAAWKKHHQKGPSGMTPGRKKVFEVTLKAQKDPAKVLTMAATFDKAGLKAEAGELKKRAAILSAPPSVVKARKEVFLKALKSTDQAAVKKVADAFHNLGHYDAAAKLRAYSRGLLSHFPGKASAAASMGARG